MNDRVIIMFLIAGFILVIGLVGVFKKVQLPYRVSMTLKKSFAFLSCLLLLTFILFLFGIYFRGYWTTKIIIWVFIITASVVYPFCNRQVLTKGWRRFSGVIFYFPLVLYLLLVTPTYLLIFSFMISLRIAGDPKAIYYNDKEIRIQKICSDCEVGFGGSPEYFEKKGMFEISKGYLGNNNGLFNDTIKVEKTKENIIVYLFYSNSDPVPFRFNR